MSKKWEKDQHSDSYTNLITPNLIREIEFRSSDKDGIDIVVFAKPIATCERSKALYDELNGAGFEQEEEESGESVVEAATDAVRAMLSGPSEVQNIALAAGALSSIDRMLLALLTPAKRQNIGARKACRAGIAAPQGKTAVC